MMQTSKPYFEFPAINNTDEFSFEKLTPESFRQLYLLFENDDSPFTDERFKMYKTAEKYANDLEKYGRYSPKHGTQDWLFKWENEYAGVLHLYDRSLETFGENNKRCWIGFAIKPPLRKKGITKKVVSHFIKYIVNQYPGICYIHAMTLKDNKALKPCFFLLGLKRTKQSGFRKNMISICWKRITNNRSQHRLCFPQGF